MLTLHICSSDYNVIAFAQKSFPVTYTQTHRCMRQSLIAGIVLHLSVAQPSNT